MRQQTLQPDRSTVHNFDEKESSSNRRNFKTPALHFSTDEKHFGNGAFQNWWRHDNHVISLTEFSSNTNPKWAVIVPFSNSSWRSVDGKHLMHFQSETFVLKFLRHSVDGKFGLALALRGEKLVRATPKTATPQKMKSLYLSVMEFSAVLIDQRTL